MNGDLFLCDFCGTKYKQKSYLQRHKKKKHNIIVEKLFKCHKCDSQFNHMKNLKKHQISKHNIIFKQDHRKVYSCDICYSTYSWQKSLRLHQARVHNIFSGNNKCTYQCYNCEYESKGKENLINHYEGSHNLNIILREEEFTNLNEFFMWKKKKESETRQSYIQARKSYTDIGGIKHHYYHCHRSGKFVSESEGKRRMRRKGSKKINAFCPANIKVNEMSDGTCKVYFTETHVSHDSELDFLSWRNKKWDQVAIGNIKCNLVYTCCKSCVHFYRTTNADAEIQLCMCRHNFLIDSHVYHDANKTTIFKNMKNIIEESSAEKSKTTVAEITNPTVIVSNLLHKKIKSLKEFTKFILNVEDSETYDLVEKTLDLLCIKISAHQ